MANTMMFRCWCAVAVIALTVGTTAAEVQLELEDNVVVLTEKSFDDWIATQPLALVEFYAPWCGHCKSLAPEWSSAAATLRETEPPLAVLAKVDATQEASLAERHGVQGYPTIYAFRYGVKDEYDGPREAPGILAWIDEQGPPGFEMVDNVADVEKFVTQQEITVVAVVRPPVASSKIFGAVKSLAKAQRKEKEVVGFAVDSGASFDVKQKKYVSSVVGEHLHVEMGAVVFYDHGKLRVKCAIKAKHYSAKTLEKCIADHRQGEL